ncbi:hypothetical protein [Cytobacillus massiliigabonensis]|uniref:hypothetical protein n=1 Tax=Cytobacillus massiliigabonensis TaxID=1871011 RepID=UPI000C85CFD1|nr:hypothetical protein [Cytobacillus massiliigabonensis]
MKIWKNVNSQSGAALMLVLFVVLFISIISAALLASTTYSLKSNEKNKKNQGAFYTVEGAVDLILEEMNSYEGKTVPVELRDKQGKIITDKNGKPITVLVKQMGPYFYLKDKSPLTVKKTIGDKSPITITIDKKIIDPDTYLASISANGTNISRYVELEVEKRDPFIVAETGALNKPVYYNKSFSYSGSSQHDNIDIKNNNEEISDQTYNTILKNIGYPVTYNNSWVIYNSYSFKPGIHNPIQITYSGNGDTMIIPKDSTVFAQSVNISGSGKTKVTIQIDGVLVVDSFNMSGNSTVVVNGALIVTNQFSKSGGGNDDSMIINSGIIAKNFTTNGKNNFSGEAKGIDCSLLGLTDDKCIRTDNDTSNPENRLWESSMQVTNYETLRQ